MKKPLIIVLLALVVLVVGLAQLVKPVPILPEEELKVVTGEIVRVSEGSSYDVFFSLKNTGDRFYINRGLERGLSMDELKKLVGETVVIKYPEYQSVFGGNTHHLSKLELGSEVIFSELGDSPVH